MVDEREYYKKNTTREYVKAIQTGATVIITVSSETMKPLSPEFAEDLDTLTLNSGNEPTKPRFA